MAEKAIDITAKMLKKRKNINSEKCKTKKIQICGGEFKNRKELLNFLREIENMTSKTNLSLSSAEKLTQLYGRQAKTIINKMSDFNMPDDQENLIRSELWFSMHFEAVLYADDFFERRSSRLFFDPQSIHQYLSILISDMKNYLHWTDIQASNEFNKMTNLLEKITSFRSKNLT